MTKAPTLAHILFSFVLLYSSISVGQAPTQENTEAQPTGTNDINSPEAKGENNTEQEMVKSPEPRKKIDTQNNTLTFISEEVDASDLIWLESDGEKFMGLWKNDTTGTPFGAVLILHGEGQSAAWPYSIDAIRNNLGRFGWATLAISLPSAKKNSIPKRPNNTPKPVAAPIINEEGEADDLTKTQAPEPSEAMPAQTTHKENSEPVPEASPSIDPEKKSIGHISAAIAYLNGKGHYNIAMVAQGSGVIRAAKYIDQQTNKGSKHKNNRAKIQRPFRAFVLIEPRNYLPMISDKKLTSFLNDQGLPILDIYYGDHNLDRHEIKERKLHARSKSFLHYFQIKVLRPNKSDPDTESRLTRRIRGFLSSHAKGVEVERK